MSALSKIYYRVFRRYRRIELVCVDYMSADEMLWGTWNNPLPTRWVLATPEEDLNRKRGMVWLERRERIVE